MKNKLPFGPADILIPKTDLKRWACVACDQFTSQPEYWQQAYAIARDAPSCLHITLPEVFLDKPDCAGRIAAINANMASYLEAGIFNEYKDALILVERRLSNGKVRRGLVGAFSLADYSYTPGEASPIRPTEGTVLSRIPPRVKIRKDAPLELPHILVLMDDGERRIIEKLDTSDLQLIYDVELMLGGGHLKGWLLPHARRDALLAELGEMAAELNKNGDGLIFAVGDGNHSLASAKASAGLIGTPEAQLALAELVSIHDSAIEFEPIYRVVFNVDTADFIAALRRAFPGDDGNKVEYLSAGENGSIFVNGLEAELLQNFIDAYLAEHPGAAVDYIHGEEALRALAAGDRAVGFLFGGIEKSALFAYVREKGVFPRKTFSIGEAQDKRYYMEARRIR